MGYANKEIRNRADRARRARKAGKKHTGKTTFADFWSIPLEHIQDAKVDGEDIYYVRLVNGALTIPNRRYDAQKGELRFSEEKERHSDDENKPALNRPWLKGAWFTGVLRPMVIAAIEEKFGIDLPHFDADEADEDDAAFCRSIIDDRIARQVQISAEEFVSVAMHGGVPRNVAQRWIEKKFDRTFDWEA
jgi:hypothetical protein